MLCLVVVPQMCDDISTEVKLTCHSRETYVSREWKYLM